MTDSVENREDLQSKAESAIKTFVQPSMAFIMEFIQSEYLAKTRPEIAATSLPNGQDFYQECIRFHTTTNMTAKEIHEIGLREVEAIEAEMREVNDKSLTANSMLNFKSMTDHEEAWLRHESSRLHGQAQE